MSDYAAPVRDMRFAFDLVGFDRVAALPVYAETATPDLVDAVLDEAAKVAAGLLAPLNRVGDRQGSRLENGVVRTPDGFKEAYRAWIEGGWNGLPFEPEHGGQGLPVALAMAVHEMWESANMSFALCPMLNMGAVELLAAHGTETQKAIYLPKLVSGEWTGAMNLTEPQAGSDLAAVRTRAVKDGDRYKITGQKIFITYGEHDFTDNIVHLVLARTPDAPAGVKGISLFVVPKFLVKPDGSLGERNDLRCVALEHKLGIHASPTAVMAFGDSGGAVGYLVGDENRGLEYMFTMMNNARLGVGVQGVAIAERAYQQARAYAASRVQGRELGAKSAESAPILRHPDVRRMLMTMKAQIEAARLLTYSAAVALDLAKRAPDAEERALWQERIDLLTPVAKAWNTDIGVDVASMAVQVHGGMGFIEETGAAQHYRDARISPIYEGTNGIQANDLAFRKVIRDGGAAARRYLEELRGIADELGDAPGDDLATIRGALVDALDALEDGTAALLDLARGDSRDAAAAATPFLRLFGIAAGGALLAKAALRAMERLGQPNGDASFLEAKLVTARFYAENLLPQSQALLTAIRAGGRSVMALADDQF